MAATKVSVSLKLLIEKKSQRVLFAEAEKKFVDFLFSIFTLPLGTVTRRLQKQDMAGCLHSLYKSIENLCDIYLQPDQDKNFLLNPKVAISGAEVPLLLPSVELSYTAMKFYRCDTRRTWKRTRTWTSARRRTRTRNEDESGEEDGSPGNGNSDCSSEYVANDRRAICPHCESSMTSELKYVEYPPRDIKASSSIEGGYVKGVITYMVMDDLDVKPMSIISAITLLTKFNVRDVGAVEEKVVDLGMDEVWQSPYYFLCITTIYQFFFLFG
jgi:hypothetical protein